MGKFSLPRIAKAIWVSAAFLSLTVMDTAFAQTPEQFTVDHTVKFVAGTDKERALFQKIPAARKIVQGEFAMAQEDLDGDGKRELILLARSPSLCRDGGCALLVLQIRDHSVETLLVKKVTEKLALSKERVDGYRALAVLDGTGQIAVGNRSNSALFGKQVVYTMRSRAQAPTESATAETVPAKGTASASAESTSIEMVDLIKMFMQPKGGPTILGDWTFGAQQRSPISWETTGIKETSLEEQKAGYPYYRVGEAVLTVEGKPTHQVLERSVVPDKWMIKLSGPRAGFTRVTLGAGNSGELGAGILESLKKQLPLRLYRCKTPSVSSGNKVYQVQGTGKKPIWINEEWSCGSAGCGLTLDIVFTKKEADKFQCF